MFLECSSLKVFCTCIVKVGVMLQLKIFFEIFLYLQVELMLRENMYIDDLIKIYYLFYRSSLQCVYAKMSAARWPLQQILNYKYSAQ